ncbi:uncharacterized serine-rich protein C215.13 [Micropterus salmoides]|uniref:uncharacterized serine-rich protein C215.13 n=1 Tax=Micropterus salmoides TaxID=27706 RepID=UPI0018EC2B58|nr:uncharacterized serine-rich protein C215.13 [Micropterus salmoides]
MTIDFTRLIFIWLLPLTGSSTVTSGQDHNFTHVTAGEVGNKLTHDQLTTQELSSLNPLSEVSGKHSLQTTPTTPSKTFLPNIQTAPTPNPISSQLNNSIVGINSSTEVTTSATTMETSHGSNPTITTRVPPMLSSSTQSLDTGKTSTFQLTSDKMTRQTQSTNLISTTTSSTKHVDSKSTSTRPVTGGDATQSTKSSMAMTKTPFTHTTRAKKRQNSLEKKAKPKQETTHSKAVAGLIGGALVLMMVGFLVIYIKKQKLQRQQITTTDWAGPSPFLEGGADNGQVTLRSSNRISLSSFLPLRLSKRLSLLPETDEELEDMTPGTTFGNKHQGSSFGQVVDENDVQEGNNETAIVVLEMKSTGAA